MLQFGRAVGGGKEDIFTCRRGDVTIGEAGEFQCGRGGGDEYWKIRIEGTGGTRHFGMVNSYLGPISPTSVIPRIGSVRHRMENAKIKNQNDNAK